VNTGANFPSGQRVSPPLPLGEGRGEGTPTNQAAGETSPAVIRWRVVQGRADQGGRCLSRRRVQPDPARTEQRSVPEGSANSARLSFGYFSLAKQRKVARPPGRDPASHDNKNITSKDKEIRSESPASSAASPPPRPTTAASRPSPPSPPTNPGTCESWCSSRSAPPAAPWRASPGP